MPSEMHSRDRNQRNIVSGSMDGSPPLTLWALVTKCDAENKEANSAKCEEHKRQLLSVPMWPQWTARDVQVTLLKALGLGYTPPAMKQNIIKVRDAQGALLPLTPTVLNSTSVHPLLIEVCRAHQNVPTEESEVDALHPSFRRTVKALITRYEQRLAAVEAGLVGLESRKAALIEVELRRLQDTLAYMSHRLDRTHVPNWVTEGQT